MPEPIPAILPGQLAVDAEYRGRRLAAADPIGARAIVVQAIDGDARSFYEHLGFRRFSEVEPLMPVLRMSELKSLLSA